MRDTVRQIVYCGICLQTFQLRRTKEDGREVTDLSCISRLSRLNKGGFRPACAVRNFYPLRTCRSSILALAYSIFSPSCQTPPIAVHLHLQEFHSRSSIPIAFQYFLLARRPSRAPSAKLACHVQDFHASAVLCSRDAALDL